MKENKDIQENQTIIDEDGNQISINPEIDSSKESLVDKKTLRKYRIHWYQKIPYPVRALFIKYWFFGLNYFLFDMGLASIPFFRENTNETFYYTTLILIFVAGFALGVFNDIFVYNILEVIEDDPKQSKPYIFFKSKKLYSLFINIIYGILVGFLTHWLCAGLTTAIDPTNGSFWFREAFSCALIGFIVDGAFIGLKNLLVLAYHRFFKKDSIE